MTSLFLGCPVLTHAQWNRTTSVCVFFNTFSSCDTASRLKALTFRWIKWPGITLSENLNDLTGRWGRCGRCFKFIGMLKISFPRACWLKARTSDMKLKLRLVRLWSQESQVSRVQKWLKFRGARSVGVVYTSLSFFEYYSLFIYIIYSRSFTWTNAHCGIMKSQRISLPVGRLTGMFRSLGAVCVAWLHVVTTVPS